jgi:hypothetical protein
MTDAEICKLLADFELYSRLLQFYLRPKNEHGFHDLFLSSLYKG